jgi:hypothetical protein
MYSAGTGAHALSGDILSKYGSLGWENGLGYPTSDQQGIQGGQITCFEKGDIAWTPNGGANAVWYPGPFMDYSPVSGVLFGPGGPSYRDVQQGNEADCWLMASLAEVAALKPALIQGTPQTPGMFTYEGTISVKGGLASVYSVQLYDTNGVLRSVTVDSELPGGGSIYARPVNRVVWAALAEKAYAEANALGYVYSARMNTNSYDALGNVPRDIQWDASGGNAWWALRAITGDHASSMAYIPSSPWSSDDITNAWNSGQLIVLGSFDNEATAMSVNGANVAYWHAYAVVGYDSSTKQFTLLNPWGVNGRSETLTNGNSVFCAGTVTGTAGQLIGAFGNQALGSGAGPGAGYGRHARSSQELADLAFIADLLDQHAKHRAIVGVGPTSAVRVN